MNKTVHKTITQKTFKPHTVAPRSHKSYVTQAELVDLNPYLQKAASELMQPRSEVIARILQAAKYI